jgi:hypothetical protein
MKSFSVGAALLSLLISSAWGAPTMMAGSATGAPGTTVDISFDFDPGADGVAGLQFNLVLPSSLTAGLYTPGNLLNTAGKTLAINQAGDTLTVIVFGLNQLTMGAGTIMTLPLTIAPGTPGGNMSLVISNAIYTNASGVAIPAGPSVNGTVTVPMPASVLTSIAVTPLVATIPAAGSQQFIATPKDQFGAPMAAIPVTWNSSNASAATVNATGLVTGNNTGSSPLTSNITATGGGLTSNAAALTVNGVSRVLTSITISPASATIGSAGTQQYVATARDQFGAVMTGVAVTWNSSNSAAATINASGLATGTNAGAGALTANIFATASGITSNTAVLTVAGVAPILTSITVSPAAATIAAAGTQQFTAVARNQFGAVMSGVAVTWASSNASAAAISASGLATGRNTGAFILSSNITASAGGVTSSPAVLTVNAPASVLTSIALTPPAMTIVANGTQQFTAAPRDQFGNPMSGITLTWASSNASAATINSSGLATGRNTGPTGLTTNITASAAGVTSNAAILTVNAAGSVVTSITVTPSAAAIAAAGTQQFTASVKDQFGATMGGVALTWASSNASAATIAASGLATGKNTGATTLTSNVTASASGVTSNAAVLTVSAPPPVTAPTLAAGAVSGQTGTTVNLPITFNPGSTSVAGLQFNLTLPAGLSAGTVAAGSVVTAAGKSISSNLSGNVLSVIVFGLNQTTIGAGSLATIPLTIAAGTAAGTLALPISAAVYTNAAGAPIAAGASTNGSVTVTAPPPPAPVLTSIALTPVSATIAAAGTQQFTATAKDQFGANMSGVIVSWASSNPSAAVVSASGMATGKNTGASTLTSNITASASGVTSNAAVLTVSAVPVVTAPTLAGGSASGQSGTTVNLPITFNPGATAVASLQFNLTLPAGLSAGTIAAGPILTAAGKSITSNRSGNTLTVIVFGLNQTAIGAGSLATIPLTIAAGTAAGTLALPISAAVYSNAAGAPIAAGANTNGSVTVTAPPVVPVLTSIAITPTAATIAANGAQQFSAVARNQFGANMSGVIVSWASSNPSAAVVSASGMATGRNAGSNALTAIITASASGITSNQATLTVNGSGVTPPVVVPPTLSVGSASGQAGSSVDLPIAFNPGTSLVAGLQFNLALPAGVSFASAVGGPILNASSKTLTASVSGGHLVVNVSGLSATALGGGTLMTARLNIAANAATGVRAVPISSVNYVNATGASLPSGVNANGSLTVTPGSTDTTAPRISDVRSLRARIWASSATISWDTDEPADSQVYYGPSLAMVSKSALNPALVSDHSVVLTGLQPWTFYYFTVRSKDAAGNLATSGIHFMRTKHHRGRLRIVRIPSCARSKNNQGPSATASAGGLKGSLLVSNVEIEEGLEPITSVKLLYSDIDGSTYSYNVGMTSTDTLNFVGYIDSNKLKGAGSMKFKLQAEDAAGLADQSEEYDLSLTKSLTVAAQDGNFKVPDSDLSVRSAPSAAGEIQFTALDANSLSLRVRGEKEIDTRHGDQPIAPLDLKLPGQAATVFNQPVSVTLSYSDIDGADKNGDGIPDGDGYVDGGLASEHDLRLFTHDGLQWRMIGGKVDPVKNTVTANVNHFTTFALFPVNAGLAASVPGLALEKFLTPTLVDGINDVATFGIAADKVSIFDVMGRKVYSASQSNSSAIIWNCRDEIGRIVESGVYIAKISQNDGSTVYQSFAVAK